MVKADVRSEEGVKHLVHETMKLFGKIDLLINNANMTFAVKPVGTNFHKLMNEMHTQFMMCQAVAPFMEKQGGGKIVNIASGLAKSPSPCFIAHGSAKASVIAFSKHLA